MAGEPSADPVRGRRLEIGSNGCVSRRGVARPLPPPSLDLNGQRLAPEAGQEGKVRRKRAV
eukprot:9276424-Alexandrium_andersonii.AAC.1